MKRVVSCAVLLVALSYLPARSAPPYPGRIVFQSRRSGNGEIYLLDAGKLTNLTKNPADDDWPSFSPDGSKILFTSSRDGHLALYQMNDDGTGVERLVSDPTGDVTYGSYSADGKRIIFTGPSATLHQSIYTYDIASKRVSGPVGQTNSPCQWGRISRGGKYLLYTALRRPTGAPGGPYVIVQDLVTKQMVAIGKGCEPEFTPDGKQVVYVHLKQGDTHSDLIAYTITTGLKTRLTNLNGFPYCPRVSPDGKWIVFAITSDKHQANGWEIYLMPFAPLAPATQLTHNNFEDVNPDIS